MKECFLCGRNGAADPLDMHHIFPGPYRKKSDQYGLVVPLCHYRCHEDGEYSVHKCMETMLQLKALGQRKVMDEQGWTTERFIQEFGKNYLAIYEDIKKENNYAESDYCDGETDEGPGAAGDRRREEGF